MGGFLGWVFKGGGEFDLSTITPVFIMCESVCEDGECMTSHDAVICTFV